MRRLINGEAQYKQRCQALRELVNNAEVDRGRARDLLRVVDALLNCDVHLNTYELSPAKFEQMLKTVKDLPARVEAGLKLCAMMARLTRLCEPKGNVVGPSCAVTLIEFEKLDRAGLFALKGPAGSLAMGLTFSSKERSKKRGLGLLSKEDQALYEEAKPYCREGIDRPDKRRPKPTLISLASSILSDLHNERGFSRRNVTRILAEAQEFPFKEEDVRTDYLRRSMFHAVNSFGSDKTTMLQRLAEVQKGVGAMAVIQLRQVNLASVAAVAGMAGIVAQAEFAQAIAPALGHLFSHDGELGSSIESMLKGFGSLVRPPLRLVSSS